ncbi:MAG: hypothetical protein WBG11_15510 [Methylocella sp.]
MEKSGTVEIDVAPAEASGAKPGARNRAGRVIKPVKRQHEQSSIVFPYMDLDTGVSVARAILGTGGVPLSRDQLAGVMNANAAGGSFITKIATARIFGLIASAQGKYELTNLGFAITDSDEKRQRAARAEAFLYVELYRRTYEEFKGRQLPPRPNGLEQAFASFGVSPKQTYNARLAFDRSATQAGFFSAGHDRLIEPIIGAGKVALTSVSRATATAGPLSAVRNLPTTEENKRDEENERAAVESSTPETRKLHPFIRGLLESLPAPETNWTVEGRAKWLQAAANIFDLMYKGSGEIHITVKGEQKPQE